MGRILLVVLCVSAIASQALAMGITVGPGSTMHLGSGVFNLGCNDVVIQSTGTLHGEGSTVNLAGNWSNFGTFIPGTSTVSFLDGCVPNMSTLSGNTSFYNLSITTSLGKQVKLQAGATQTIANSITLAGAAGNLLDVCSTAAGSAAFLNLLAGGTQFISYIDVKDNRAVGQVLAPGPPFSYSSIDGGGASNWFLNVFLVAPAPVLSTIGAILACMLLLAVGLLGMKSDRSAVERPQGG